MDEFIDGKPTCSSIALTEGQLEELDAVHKWRPKVTSRGFSSDWMACRFLKLAPPRAELMQNNLKSCRRTTGLKLAAVSNGEPHRFRGLEYIKVREKRRRRGVWRGCAKRGVVFRLQTDQTEPMIPSHRARAPRGAGICACAPSSSCMRS